MKSRIAVELLWPKNHYCMPKFFLVAIPASNVLLEVVVSTNSNVVNHVCGGTFNYKLSECINFGNNRAVHVAVKDISFPEVKKELSFKLHAHHFLEKFKETDLKDHKIIFKTMEELCMNFEFLVNKALGSLEMPSLDFRAPNVSSPTMTVSVGYKNNRIFLKKHPDLIIRISANLAKYMKFNEAILDSYTDSEKAGKTEAELIEQCDKVIKLENTCYLSDAYCYVIQPKDCEINFILYNLFESYTVIDNGSRMPIFFRYDLNGPKVRPNKFLAIKQVSVPFLRDMRFAILNSKYEPLSGCTFDLKNNPFSCKLIFFRK